LDSDPVFGEQTRNVTSEQRLVVGYERGAVVECSRGDEQIHVALDDATPPERRLEVGKEPSDVGCDR